MQLNPNRDTHSSFNKGVNTNKQITDTFFQYFSGNCVVHVRAQVMMRDDSTGGWLPLGGGGMSNVSVRKTRKLHQVVDEPCNHEYIIFGKRATDQTVSLNCILENSSRILLPSCPLSEFWLEKLMNTRKKVLFGITIGIFHFDAFCLFYFSTFPVGI